MKSDTIINDVLITDYYTIIIGENLNYILLHSIDHNNFLSFSNTEFKTEFYTESSNSYKNIIKLNNHSLSNP